MEGEFIHRVPGKGSIIVKFSGWSECIDVSMRSTFVNDLPVSAVLFNDDGEYKLFGEVKIGADSRYFNDDLCKEIILQILNMKLHGNI